MRRVSSSATCPRVESNWRATGTLGDYLRENNVIGIADIDTRKLTRILREKGAQNGCIVAGPTLAAADAGNAIAKARAAPSMAGLDLAKVVSCTQRYEWAEGGWALDGGFRKAPAARIPRRRVRLRHQAQHPAPAGRSRLQADRRPGADCAADVLALRPDGVFLSNGPGDPEPCTYAISAIREIVDSGMPTFGICLGHQLLGLASGARTVKMKFGHHGANHPVLDRDTGQVLITSQNHGFAVDAATLPANVRVTHVSLFDGSLQGIARTDRPAFGFQGHPEASPGPHDLKYLFDRFVKSMATTATA